MILLIDSDVTYLVAPNAKSCIAGYFYLGDGTKNTTAETGGVYHNCQFGLHIRRMLQVLNHPQPPTLVKIDNSTAESFINNQI